VRRNNTFKQKKVPKIRECGTLVMHELLNLSNESEHSRKK
jgi:hypothetical protein